MQNPTDPLSSNTIRVGILGGGQLGRMLLEAAGNFPVETFIMEDDPFCPAAGLCHHFIKGNIRDFEAVYRFGKQLEALTVEIENVNVEALEKLEKEGLKIFPKPSVLKTIRNKILQKQYYTQHGIPTAAFRITNDLASLQKETGFFPAVHKIAEGGYDGRGVQVLKTSDDIGAGFDAPAILEKMIYFEKEIALMVAINEKKETAIYPPVEMIFDSRLNLLDYQFCPAELKEITLNKACEIAKAVALNFNSPGLFAVEMFVDRQGEIFVNETAPRVHNSGHHTIEAHHCSQFEMMWRLILGLSPGNTEAIQSSLMLNIIGAGGFEGDVQYRGLEEVKELPGTFVHLYGKRQTRPGRKMGHVTLMGNDKSKLMQTATYIKKTLIAAT